MQNREEKLNLHLDSYIHNTQDPAAGTSKVKQLGSYSDEKDFLEVSIALLRKQDLSHHKVKLLTTMVINRLQSSFEELSFSKVDQYEEAFFDFAKNMGIEHQLIFNNISEILAIIYLMKIGKDDNTSLKTYLTSFTETPQKIESGQYYFNILNFCPLVVENKKFTLQSSMRKGLKQKLLTQRAYVMSMLSTMAECSKHKVQFDKKTIIACFQNWTTLKYSDELYNSFPEKYIFKEIIRLCCVDEKYVESASKCLKNIMNGMQIQQNPLILYGFMYENMVNLVTVVNEHLMKGCLLMAEELMLVILTFMNIFHENLVENYSSEMRMNILEPVFKFEHTKWPKVINQLLEVCIVFMGGQFNEDNIKFQQNQISEIIPKDMLEIAIEVFKYPQYLFEELNSNSLKNLKSKYAEVQHIQTYHSCSQDLFEVICQKLGVEKYCSFIEEKINQIDFNSQNCYIQLEVYLYILSQPVKNLKEVTDFIKKLVDLLEDKLFGGSNQTKIPLALLKTVVKLLREMFQIQQKSQEFVLRLFKILEKTLSEQIIFMSAQKTFEKGCKQNILMLNSHLQELFPIVQKYHTGTQIINGFMIIACEKDETVHYVEKIINLVHENFISQSNPANDSLRCLISIFTNIKSYKITEKKALVKKYLQKAWPFLMQVLKNPQNTKNDHDTGVELVVKLLKLIIRLLQTHFQGFIEALSSQIIAAFKIHPFCSYAYLTEIEIKAFSNKKEYQENLFFLYENVCDIALNQHFQQYDSIDKYPMLVDDVIGMNTQFLKCNTKFLVKSDYFSKFLQFVFTRCYKTNQTDIVRSKSTFWERLSMLFWDDQFITEEELEKDQFAYGFPEIDESDVKTSIKAIFLKHLEEVVENLFMHLSQKLSSPIQNAVLCCLEAILKAFPRENLAIWKKVINKFSAAVLQKSQKERLIEYLGNIRQKSLTGASKKTILKEIITILDLISRRMNLVHEKRKLPSIE